MAPTADQVTTALGGVIDPEIKKPITELGMVESVVVREDGVVAVRILLTVAGCPMKDTLTRDTKAAVSKLDGVTGVEVDLGVMSAEQRSALQTQLRGGVAEKEIPFSRADSLTKVFAIASGKGGVGKSSVTVNLAVAMARQGLSVGVLDADIYGHSIPAMFGVADERPTAVDDMIMPVPAHGVKVISIGMLKPKRDQVVAWRGPILDRALVQMLADVYWGDLDVLLLDLPPGTGDIAISVGQRLTSAEVIVVTTPQEAAAEVAERAGTMAQMVHQRVAGVVENMSYLPCPHCGPEHRIEIFGTGGGTRVAETLSARLGYPIPLLGEIPLDERLRSGGDLGTPLATADPETPAAQVLTAIATKLGGRPRGLLGRQLGLSPAGR
ncbi:Mrp/NBP35 family ATP-binding protein [Kribbella sandramycini]|uniref:Iron-sulfur cluster carrier protein n=1 Tax=Kribbella sandramycini TaxID=60450 RepID=A0A7Y4L2T6_9ACTN|nr:P-loop NTPase [Kribbella sandramycini]MBB6571338.1 ATP-binding protein involved in chromosome partitioning [Kribbella sandramycini]NOL43259.1 Mrp/NBP35 family ATP-binding protein [Kribbella sandramycini]